MSKNQKRNQHKIKLFQFHEIKESSRQLHSPEATQRTITLSDSIYLHHLRQVVAELDPSTNFTDAIFMLKADNIDEDDPSQLALIKHMLREGIYYKDEQYVRSIKSPAMGRTQRTEFIRKKFYDSLYNRITLGKHPDLTNINKWEAALGVSRSTAIPIPYIPRIVVIPDYKKNEIIEDVWKVEECEVDSEAQKLVQAEKKKQSAYFKARKELKPSDEKLKQLKSVPYTYIEVNGGLKHAPDHTTYKTFNGWNKEGRRVKLDQIASPVRSVEYNGNLYPCYSIDQTEEIPMINISEESIGLKRVEYPNYKNKDVQFFDGQGLMSFEFAEKIQEQLKLKHPVNAVQGRLPYIKGNFIRFDIHKWLKEHHITEIADIFNQPQPLIDKDGRPIDLIITKSCFKAWHQYIEGQEKPECIFENIAEYEELLKTYHHDHFWIANYAKPSYQINPYTPLTYQYIHALNLSLEGLYKLASPMLDVIKRILQGKKDDYSGKWLRDIAHTKAFLNMLVQEDDSIDEDLSEVSEAENEEESQQKKKFVSEIIKAIDINELMLYDGNVRKFIVKQAMLKVEDMLKGRITIRGSYYYMTNDPIAFMEHAVGKSVKGVLKQNQAFMNRKLETHALFRSPLTIFNEVAKLEFVKVHNPYLRHLNNVIVLNCHDLTLIRLGLADVDGDTALCTNDPTILSAVIDAPTIINEDDKKVADPVPNTIDSIVNMELKSLHNLTGRCTNVNSYFQNLALEEGSLQSRVLENACLKFLQGQIIDATKNGRDVEIPHVLDRFAVKMPYYFRFINGGTEKEYQITTKTPFNQFCVKAEKYIKRTLNQKDGKLDRTILGIESTKQLLQDFNKVSQSKFMEYVDQIEPLYTDYNAEKSRIDYRRKQFNEKKKWERDNDTRKSISEEYAKLKADFKAKCEAICPYPSILASVAVEIAYYKFGTHSFAWLFVDGLLENLKKHENVLKKEVRRVNRLSNRNVDGDQLTVQDGIASIGDIAFEFNVPDGNYCLIEILGQYFIWHEVKRESDVEVGNTPALLDGNSTRKPLQSYKLGISTLKKSKEESQLLADDVIRRKFLIHVVDNRFVNIVDANGQLKCCVPRNQIINQEEKISLFDYDGAEIEFVQVNEVYKSSFAAVVNIA